MCGGNLPKFPAFIFLNDAFCWLCVCVCVFAFNRKNADCCPSTAIFLVMEENGDIRSCSDRGEASSVHVYDGKGNLMPYLDILFFMGKNLPFLFSTTSIFYFRALKSSRGSFPT